MRIFLLLIALVQFGISEAGMFTVTTAPGSGNKKVYYISVDAGNSTVIDSAEGTNSFFLYIPKTDGYYTAKVVYLETTNYLPTYMGNTPFWESSTSLYVGSADSVGQTITSLNASALSGSGSISGSITQGNLKVAAGGAPLNNIEILLINTSTNLPVAYTYTDAAGAYQFSNLPYGAYKVYAEVVNRTNNNPPTITLNSSTSQKTGVNISISSKSVDVTAVEEQMSSKELFNCYPNPVKETLRVECSQFVNQVDILNSKGEIVLSVINHELENEFNLSTLTPGMYYVKGITAEGLMTIRKIIKQ